MKKTLASLALAGVLTLSVGAVAAQAAPEYPAPSPGATISDSVIAPGQVVIYTAGGFDPFETVIINIVQTSTIAGGAIGSLGGGVSASMPLIIQPATPTSITTQADAKGFISVEVPLDMTGTFSISATGQTSGFTSAAQVVKVVVGGETGNGTAGGAGNGTGTGNDVAGAGNDGGLANTGLDAGVITWSIVGAGALAAGVGTVVVSRRRSRNTENA